MTAILVVIAAGALSYALRVSMLVVAAHRPLPPVLARAARLAVPTAFAALAAGAIVSPESGGIALVPLAAIVVAGVAVRRSGSAHAAVLVGLPVVWVLSAVTGR